MSNPQITIRVTDEIKARFDAYAESVGLDNSELFKLLIVRERIGQRLKGEISKGKPPKPTRRRTQGKKLPTITAHLSKFENVTAFDEYAADCNLSRSAAGAWLITHELEEEWLLRCLRITAM